jgi:hypothetical protein
MVCRKRMVKRDFHLYRLVAYIQDMYTNMIAYRMPKTSAAAATLPKAMVRGGRWVLSV